MALEEYKRKRNFGATPEPEGKVKKTKGSSFVIQKHAATRLHYDFRLEMDGVLKSWAVPKGPSLDPAEKRLAVHVEDHPIDYGDFEGVIPKGQYGGGTVLLWDHGTWHSEWDPEASYKKGHFKFRLEGEKLHGGWHLVKMHGRQGGENGENWLLFKEEDEFAVPGSGDAVVQEYPDSVETGLSIEEIAADPERVWQSNRAEKTATAKKTAAKKKAPASQPAVPGAKKAKMPAEIEPQLATLVDAVPRGVEWVHEIKYDGYRALCRIQDGEAALITRAGKDWTDRFRSVAREAAELPVSEAILDGEVVVLNPDGTTSFQGLQTALSENRQSDLVYFAFDLLYLDGYDLRKAALADRKAALTRLLEGRQEAVRLGDHVEADGEAFYAQACKFGLEGIICKRADLPYHSGRNKDWLKVKCLKRQEFVIAGFTDPEGSRQGLGALLLAVNEGKELRYAGKVGTGFDAKTLRQLRTRLGKLAVDKPPVANPPRGAEGRRAHWVKPDLVAEVEFMEWTRDGLLRHSTFQGLREDKKAAEVVREEPQAPPRSPHLPDPQFSPIASPPPPSPPQRERREKGKMANSEPSPSGRGQGEGGPKPPVRPAPEPSPIGRQTGSKKESEIEGVRFTSLDRVLYPEQGLTKLDLAVYYSRVAEWILPHLKDRPLTLVRCPAGRAQQCFFQKHVNDTVPAAIHRVDVGDDEPYGTLSDIQGLLSLVQMGVLEIHIWGAHRDKVEQPDYVVFDLDPDEGLDWERVVEGALLVRDFLGELGLKTFLKTTGGKGLHVVFPLTRKDDWDEVKEFTKTLAEAIVTAHPDRYTSKITKASRKGRVFIDYLRNGRGATSICAYSTRSRPGAPVSVPLFWQELETGVRGNTYNVNNLFERLESLPADPWADFNKTRQSITAAMKKAIGMK